MFSVTTDKLMALRRMSEQHELYQHTYMYNSRINK